MPNNNRALVIGGSSGIGAAVVKRLRAPIHRGLAVTVPEDRFVELTLEMDFELDVRSDASIRDYFQDHGPFEYVVYTPGINRLNYVEDIDRTELVHVFNTNAFGFARVMGIYADTFSRPPVSTVAVVSDAARNPMRGSLAYCSSKAALEMMIKVIAREWMSRDARVNGVAPGVVDGTPLTQYNDRTIPDFRGWSAQEAAAYETSGLPMGRRAYVDEVAAVIDSTLFGPAYQTGTVVDITGGK